MGVSNWDGWHVVEANQCAKSRGLSSIVSDQIWYNLADRVVENSVIPACRNQKVSIIAWGALAQGFLGGKYRRDDSIPIPGSRFRIFKDGEQSSFKCLANERSWDILDELDCIAKKRERSISNIALRWLLQCGNCDVVLLGGSKNEQYLDSLQVMDFTLTNEEMEKLGEVSEQVHPYPRSFLELFCRKESKFYGGLR